MIYQQQTAAAATTMGVYPTAAEATIPACGLLFYCACAAAATETAAAATAVAAAADAAASAALARDAIACSSFCCFCAAAADPSAANTALYRRAPVLRAPVSCYLRGSLSPCPFQVMTYLPHLLHKIQ